MSKNDKYNKLEFAIASGAIGASLGTLFTEKKESTAITGLVGAALGATYSAFIESKKTNEGVLIEENGAIYSVFENGRKILVKELPKVSTKIPKTFTLD